MTNTMDFNSKEFKDLTAAAMKELSASGAKLDTPDEMYNAVSKYVKLTKKQFTELYNQATEKLEEENPFESKELSENELDVVVGGMPGWLKNTLIVAGCVVATALVFAAAGGLAGAALAAGIAWMEGGVAATCSAAAVSGGIGAAAGFGGFGALMGGLFSQTKEVKPYLA